MVSSPQVLSQTEKLDALVLQLLFGYTGALHFYLGRPKWGVLYFFTFGLLGVGWVADFFRIFELFKEYDERVTGVAPSRPRPYTVEEAYIFWLSFGWIGGHHAYLGNWKRATLYFFTFGGLGILFVADFFLMYQYVREANRKLDKRIYLGRPASCCGDCNDCDDDCCTDCEGNSYQKSQNVSRLSTGSNGNHTPILSSAMATGEVIGDHGVGARIEKDIPPAIVIKSTTVYTPKDDMYSTDSSATVITSTANRSGIPIAQAVKEDTVEHV